ncbi:MAG: SAM-dependent methyltransferase, partial [Saprospiraceae bacterium]
QGEAEAFLQEVPDAHLDLIYLDPARRDGQQRKVYLLEDCQPNVLALRTNLLAKAPQVLVKTAPLLDLKLAARQLAAVSHIWVVSVADECKEVLYLLERDAPSTDHIPVTAVALGKVDQQFSFTWQEEKAAVAPLSEPQEYLYEADAAILKAGAFRSFAQRFGLSKLHANTHLYTSERLIRDLPGRTFQLEQVCKYDRKTVRAAVPGGRASLATRNFPDPVDAVRRKLGLADGGDQYLFAVTTLRGRKEILVARKV